MILFLVAVLSALSIVGMAVVFGGTAALAFITAPSLFQKLEPRIAGDAFGLILRRFDRLGLVSAGIATLCSGLLLIFTESQYAKLGMFAVLALAATACFAYSLWALTPKLEKVAPPREPEAEDPRSEEDRALFDKLHKAHVRVYAANLMLSVGALLLTGMAI